MLIGMEESKNNVVAKFGLIIFSLFSFSCNEMKNSEQVPNKKNTILNFDQIDTSFYDISQFKIEGFKYCDFLNPDRRFNKVHPEIFYSKKDSITDEILYKKDKIIISQPYRFNDEDKEREVKLNDEKLVVKRILINQDDNKDWYTFSKLLIDYQSSDGFYNNGNYFLIINQPNGLSGKGNSIHFVQFISKKDKITYEFFINEDLTLKYNCLE